MEEKRYQSGDAVINEGGPGDFFYVTGSGELQVQQCPYVGSTRLHGTAVVLSERISRGNRGKSAHKVRRDIFLGQDAS